MSVDELCRIVFEGDLLMIKYHVSRLERDQLNDECLEFDDQTPLQVAVGPLPPLTSSNPAEAQHLGNIRAITIRFLILSGASPTHTSSINHTSAIDIAIQLGDAGLGDFLESWKGGSFVGYDESDDILIRKARILSELSIDRPEGSDKIPPAETWINENPELGLWVEVAEEDTKMDEYQAPMEEPQMEAGEEDMLLDDEDLGFADEDDEQVVSESAFVGDGLPIQKIGSPKFSTEGVVDRRETERMLGIRSKDGQGLGAIDPPLPPSPTSVVSSTPNDDLLDVKPNISSTPQPRSPSLHSPHDTFASSRSEPYLRPVSTTQTPPRTERPQPPVLPPPSEQLPSTSQKPFSTGQAQQTQLHPPAGPKFAPPTRINAPIDTHTDILVIPKLPQTANESLVRRFILDNTQAGKKFQQVIMIGKKAKSAYGLFVDKEARDDAIVKLNGKIFAPSFEIVAEIYQPGKPGHPNLPQKSTKDIAPPRPPLPNREVSHPTTTAPQGNSPPAAASHRPLPPPSYDSSSKGHPLSSPRGSLRSSRSPARSERSSIRDEYYSHRPRSRSRSPPSRRPPRSRSPPPRRLRARSRSRSRTRTFGGRRSRSPPRRRSPSPRRRSGPLPRQRSFTPPRRQSAPSFTPAPFFTPTSTRPKSPTPALRTPSSTASHPRLDTTDAPNDFSLLASLGLAKSDLASLERLCQPLERLPCQDFSRTVHCAVTFGYVSPSRAKYLLTRPTPYPDDDRKAFQYETWLKAQSGDSRDFYTAFFAQLTEFNDSSLMFERLSKGVEQEVEDEGPDRPWDEDAGAPRIEFDRWGNGMIVETGRISTVEKGFVRKVKEGLGVL